MAECGKYKVGNAIKGFNEETKSHFNHYRHLRAFYKLTSYCNVMKMLTNTMVGKKTLFRQSDCGPQHVIIMHQRKDETLHSCCDLRAYSLLVPNYANKRKNVLCL